MFIAVGNADADVQSFVAVSPDTVVQDQPFTVNYILSATTWEKDGCQPQSGGGFEIQDISYSVKSGRPYHQLIASVTYLTSRSGVVKLPGMIAQTNNKSITTAPKTIYVKPHPQYGEEMTYAHNWLLTNGQHPDSICLHLAENDKGFWLFNDQINECFCMISKKSIWSLVGLPVLAYSTECSINGSEDKNYHKMVQPYRNQIDKLMESKGKATTEYLQPSIQKNSSVKPLLGNLRWGQAEPYNYLAPVLNGRKPIIGCVPLAVAMVMNYYQWPAQGKSHVYYQFGKKLYKIDFSKCTPQWSSFREYYNANDTVGVENLSDLLISLGISLDANYNEEVTTASLYNIKHVLCNNLNYSGKSNLYYHQLTDYETESYIYHELDQHRPCIVTNESHAFVCDGYSGDFLHYNMGWYGSYNGFYRLMLGNCEAKEGESLILIKGVLGGIEPQRGNDISKDVNLEKTGTLAEYLSDDEKENITRLLITGPINSADIRLIRKMAGAVDELSFDSWRGGSLRVLDISQARIVNDDTPYITRKATGTRSRTTYKMNEFGEKFDIKTHTYNFETMTETEWNLFRNNVGVKFEDVFYTRTDDNRYWANYICNKDVIGAYMFADCSSLHSIILPETIKKIDSYAFMRCASIQKIRLPECITETGKTPFMSCTSMETIEIPHNFIPKSALYEKCSPAISIKKIKD